MTLERLAQRINIHRRLSLMQEMRLDTIREGIRTGEISQDTLDFFDNTISDLKAALRRTEEEENEITNTQSHTSSIEQTVS